MTSSGETIFMKPDFHDGHLFGLRVNADVLEVQCSDVGGVEYTVTIAGVIRLRADAFSEGNIIFEMKCYTHEVPDNLIRKTYGNDVRGEPAWLTAIHDRARTGSLLMFEISSSYGCELLALATGPVSINPRI